MHIILLVIKLSIYQQASLHVYKNMIGGNFDSRNLTNIPEKIPSRLFTSVLSQNV